MTALSYAPETDPADLAFGTVESPFGDLLVVTASTGLVRLAFESEDHDAVLESLAAKSGRQITEDRSATGEVARQLGEYFAGERREFQLPLDLSPVSGFRRRVLEQLRQVPYGSTVTYAALASSSGNPKAVRAVGSACATNPIPIIVPCHRVVRSDGSIGQYLGGKDAKAALLELESGG